VGALRNGYTNYGAMLTTRNSNNMRGIGFLLLSVLAYLSCAQNIPVFKAAVPDHAPIGGGITTAVTGILFEDNFPTCKFGDYIVQGKFQSAESFICTVPPMVNDTYVVSLEVSNDGKTFTKSGNTFSYYAVFSISPMHGDIAGKTPVTVYGINFEQLFACKFGNTVVPANVIDSSTLICASPRGDPEDRIVSLEVGALRNGYTNYGAMFTYEGELPSEEDSEEQFRTPVIILAATGIAFVFTMLITLGICVTRPKYIVLVPSEGEGLLN